MTENTILLTGIPRSGTTLTCALLNTIPDCLALPEPIRLELHGDRARAVAEIEDFLRVTRGQASRGEKVFSKHRGGRIIDNFAAAPDAAGGLRPVLVDHGAIDPGKPLSPGFTLFVKHPAEFTVLADDLGQRYPLWAVVRHPLAVLSAWRTVDMPVNRGRMPTAEAFCPGLAADLDREPDCLKRQVLLLRWLLGVYQGLPPERIVRYEDLTAAPERALRRLAGRAPDRCPVLEPADPRRRYAGIDPRPLARALLPLTPLARRFYPDFEDSLSPWL